MKHTLNDAHIGIEFAEQLYSHINPLFSPEGYSQEHLTSCHLAIE